MRIDLTRFRDGFFEEAADHLAALEGGLLQLEATPQDVTPLDSIFRAAHSLKGASGLLGLNDIARFTHGLEGLLDYLRERRRPITQEQTDLLLRARDVLAGLVAAAREGEDPPAEAERISAELRGELARLRDGSAPAVLKPHRYTIRFTPHADILSQGLDPLLLVRDLAALGELLEVEASVHHLPTLTDLDPERCYLSWSIVLQTTEPRSAIDDVFLFVHDQVQIMSAAEPVDVPEPAPVEVAPLGADRPPRLFGTYLVRQGLATAEQILDALDQQRASRPLLGQLALREGRLSVRQIMQILDEQTRTDARFGEAAVQLGLLSDADLGQLLLVQARSLPPLGEVLVARGVLTREQLRAALASFTGETDLEVFAEASPATQPTVPTFQCEDLALLAEFCTEAEEHLEAIDRHLLTLEATPTDQEALNAIYRAFHTIKGVASMFALETIQTLAHEAESLLNQARDGRLVLRGQPIDLVFASADALRRLLSQLRARLAGQAEAGGDPNLGRLLASLRQVLHGDTPLPSAPPRPVPAVVSTPASGDEAMARPGPAAEVARGTAGDKETVRVDRSRLDKLINTIGELVIAQAMVQQEFEDGSSAAMAELGKTARDLQELSLSLRMVPLGGLFQKMTRAVRDLSRRIGKVVEFSVSGEETELDKTLVDQLADPLLHMVRNAVDHGIESAEARTAAGKPATGHVSLRAFHQGGNVYLELHDDGKGLDCQAILAKAVERGLVAPGQKLSEEETFALIFAPGFSTAKVVTDVSGRGVGMDVVRRNVEALQGSIHIRSQPGRGTTFTIRLPLTLAIMDGLSISLGDEVYILPLLAVIESFQPRPADVHSVAGRGEVVVVRGETVPLLRLHRLLNRPARVTDPRRGLVVLVENQGRKYALLVDELLGQLQVVMKSLDVNFRKVEGIAGATILGDGRVAMILDVHGLTRLNSPVSVSAAREPVLASR